LAIGVVTPPSTSVTGPPVVCRDDSSVFEREQRRRQKVQGALAAKQAVVSEALVSEQRKRFQTLVSNIAQAGAIFGVLLRALDPHRPHRSM